MIDEQIKEKLARWEHLIEFEWDWSGVRDGLEESIEIIRDLQKERDDWWSRAISLFWSGRADRVTAGEVRAASERIKELLPR